MAEVDREELLVAHHRTKIFQWELVRTHLLDRLEAALDDAGLDRHLITTRVKTESSFVAKGLKRSIDGAYKYAEPANQIHDLVGIRLVVALSEDIPSVAAVVRQNVHVDEEIERGQEDAASAPGYQSLHVVAKLRDDDPVLMRYPALTGDVCIEIQVRSILQDAYASFHHDIAYKTERPVTANTDRKLKVLAAVLHLADEEFSRVRAQAVNDAVEVPAESDQAVIDGGWTEDELTEALRDHVGPGEDDSRAWLRELATVLAELHLPNRQALDEALPAPSIGPDIARHLRATRPWLRGTQVLDVLLQRAFGDRYVAARTEGLSNDAREVFVRVTADEQAQLGDRP